MSEMIKAYQEINKRRQSNDMDVNSLTMFAEAWDHQQAKVDELQARFDAIEKWIESNRKTIALEYSGYTTEEYVDADDLLEILKGGSSE